MNGDPRDAKWTQEAGEVAGYDSFAWFYHRYWSDHFHPWAVRLMDRLIVPAVPEGSPILDLCCGTGKLAGELTQRGYRVTGLDASEQMLRYGRQNAPAAAFLCADARAFTIRPAFACVLSMFDSMNHILSADDLLKVFRNTRECLLDRGTFVFDALLEDAYVRDWTQSCSIVDAEQACFIRGGYNPATRLGRTEVTLFQRNSEWLRTDTTFFERCYPPEELQDLLARAGFDEIRCLHPVSDLGIGGDFSEGRRVFVASV